MSSAIVDGRYVVISADCHAGAPKEDYRPYLAARWHDEFDAWVGTYEIPFADLLIDDAERSWASERRLAEMEAEGVVAEVIFPNTIPPFFSLLPPTREDAERRWAGLQAHNRWLSDFCSLTPGRRAGVAQLLLHDVEALVAEVRWAATAPGISGVLLPTVLINDPLVEPLYSAAYEPLWAACAEAGLPVHTHGGIMSSAWGVEKYAAAGAVYIHETAWVTRRAASHLILAGVFERHPALKFVGTEQGSAWVPAELAALDRLVAGMRAKANTPSGYYGKAVVDTLRRDPSDHFRTNCAIGSSFLRRAEAADRHAIGLGSIMWGSDYPHQEGTHPYTREALQWTFGGLPTDEVAAMLAGNAARVYGFDLGALGEISRRVGPLVNDVAQPLAVPPADAKSSAFAA